MIATRLPRNAASSSMRAAAAASGGALFRRTILPASPSSSCNFSSSIRDTVSLAFDHHKPPQSDRHRQDAPIVFMHGLFGSKKNNRTVSRFLSRDLGRHVYALDLRNHGESPHAPRHDYPAMAEDVAEFLVQHGLKNPTLIGHSMGAKTAMTLALSKPEAIDNLVSVDNAPVDAALNSTFANYVRGMKKIEEAGVTSMSEADKILAEFEPELPIRQFLLQNLYTPEGSETRKFRVPLGTLGKALDHLGDFPYKDPNQARFEKPALFIRGTHSKYVPDEVIPVIGQFFPRFSLVDIKAGHWLISEKPEKFLRAVVEFLRPKE